MKRLTLIPAVAAAMLAALWTTGCSDATLTDPVSQEQNSLLKRGPGAIVTDLSPAEIEDLVFIREEEKVARDVYVAMYDLWGKTIFLNISQSEQKHMDAVLKLLLEYEIEDPVGTNGLGVFTNPDLQTMYDNLVARGKQSVSEAYLVGVEIEVTDIHDLEAAIEDADTKSIINVYSRLLKASERHLESFEGHLP